MGMSPAETLACSVFEYMSALEGFVEANTPDSDKKLSEAEKDELFEWLSA